MSSAKPIHVGDSLPKALESKVMFSKYWQKFQSGQMLLRIALPSIIKQAEVEVIYERPPPKERIYEARISTLRTIPSEEIALRACSMLLAQGEVVGSESANEAWGIYIAGIGNFTPAAIRLLPGAARTKNFVDKVKEMLTWVEVEVLEFDREFAAWFRVILLDEPGIMVREFQPTSGAPLSIESVLFLMKECYIDDEAVRSIMELFSETYGANGRYLFIPPLQISLWKKNLYWDWKKDIVGSGQIEKAFAVVHMPGHWGALEVDFIQRKISFGDSLLWAVPNDTVEAVREWIRHCGVDTDQWDCRVEHFAVPRQPAGSGSCAVNATNAIEKSINPVIEGWTHQRSAYHRTRFLKLITGHTKFQDHQDIAAQSGRGQKVGVMLYCDVAVDFFHSDVDETDLFFPDSNPLATKATEDKADGPWVDGGEMDEGEMDGGEMDGGEIDETK
ncbi:hypothetical protein BG011_001237, partial [Mortierella polycephala]